MTASAKSRTASARAADAELMTQLGRGDLSPLGAFYDRYAADVRRFALRVTGKPDVAEDVTQDAFVALVDSAKRYDASYPVRSFLIGIAGKIVLQRRRRSAIALRVLSDMRGWLRRSDERTPEDNAGASERLACYRRALERLSEAKRVTLIMTDVEGLSGPEVAAVLGIPVRTVWTRLHHARAEIRRAMDMEAPQ